MKLTKERLIEIIKEELQNPNESLSDSGWKHVLRSDAPEPNLKIKTAEEALDELFPHRKKDVDNKENKS